MAASSEIVKALKAETYPPGDGFFCGVGIIPHWPEDLSPLRRTGCGDHQENPYRLANELFGVGFRTADRLAGLLGRKDPVDAERIGLVSFIFAKYTEEGHVFFPQAEFVTAVAKELEVPEEAITRGITALVEAKRFILKKSGFISPFLLGERKTAERLCTLLSAYQVKKLPFPLPSVPELETHRRAAACCQRLSTGADHHRGPGTGKTDRAEYNPTTAVKGEEVLLAAPTGRAAQTVDRSDRRGGEDHPSPFGVRLYGGDRFKIRAR